MGELLRKDWDYREEVRALQRPVLLIFADHDSVSMLHIAEFFALFGGGIREPGVIDPQFSRARLAIIPGYTHYNLGQAPEVARVIENFATHIAGHPVRAGIALARECPGIWLGYVGVVPIGAFGWWLHKRRRPVTR